MFILPYASDHRRERIPFATLALIGINTLVFSLFYYESGSRLQSAISLAGYKPSEPTIYGAVCHMFLHADIFHLASNMLILWVFGSDLEDVLGITRYVIYYLGFGFAALASHQVMVTLFIRELGQEAVVGASGAIAGLAGFYAVRFWRYKLKAFAVWFIYPRFFRFNVMILAGVWFLSQLVWGLIVASVPGAAKIVPVAFWAHIGGFAAGLGLALALRLQKQSTFEYLENDAAEYFARGNWWKAMGAYSNIAKVRPEDPAPHVQIGRCWELLGQKPRMIDSYQRAFGLALAGNDVEAAGLAWKELRDRQEAALPDVGPTKYWLLGRHFEDSSEFGESLAIYDLVVDRYPESEEAPAALLASGDLFARLGKSDVAHSYYARLVRSYPQSRWAKAAGTRLHPRPGEEAGSSQ